MQLSSLSAISPIDGRYLSKTSSLQPIFSEFGLIKYRLEVEVEYFIALCNIPLPQLVGFDKTLFEDLRLVIGNFDEVEAEKIKSIEKTTNHDVKAVEYYLKSKFDLLGIGQFKEFIHFGLTSQDINNTAVPMQLKKALDKVYYPSLNQLSSLIETYARQWARIPMLARTHGQPASPTSLGKELFVFKRRIDEQLSLLKQIPIPAKFGGATGNFNAHHVTYPEVDWHDFANEFVNNRLKLHRSHPTTQIEHYDHIAAIFDNLKRINTILIDFSRDIWQYVAMNYFRQKIKEGEIGSSAMPHKVNPIDFENAEGNLGLANSNFEYLSSKLPISRLQRDLTDSTVLRNIGVPIAHTEIAFASLKKGIEKLEINESALQHDLEQNWAVVAEAIQTILRREGYANPYEALKMLTRTNEKITKESISSFINGLEVSDKIKAELLTISPSNYTGIIPAELLG